MASQVDLQQLVVDRRAAGSSPGSRKRAWPTRWGLPLAIVAGFIGLVGWSARDRWLPAIPVTVVPVVQMKAELHQAGAPRFQAAGWIEPRPTAVTCSALAEGVVAELLVVEGQDVEANQPVARLVDADARIALREAEATVQLRTAERDSAQAALAAAYQNLEQPVHLQAAHAEAEVSLATLETEIKNLPFLVQSAEARLNLARQDLEGKKIAGEGIAGRSLQRAQSEFDTATAALAELRQRGPNLAHQQEARQRNCLALHTMLKLKTEETRARDEATANLAATEARLVQARLGVEAAKLRLERMVVRSPIQGRVLALHAQPGRRLMGLNAVSERDSSTVITLYDPAQLQVRADVRLEDVPQIQIGQPVQISTAAASDMLMGRVLATTSQADIQKNTLQVKVAIDTPSPVVRPEMLVQVVFLAPENPAAQSEGEQDALRLLVTKELIENKEGGASVWVADSAQGVARRRAVQVGRASADQLVEVTQGLTALDKLIVMGRERLTDGARIRVVGDDPTLGISSVRASPRQQVDPANAHGPSEKEK